MEDDVIGEKFGRMTAEEQDPFEKYWPMMSWWHGLVLYEDEE
jgi:hypothetical protein